MSEDFIEEILEIAWKEETEGMRIPKDILKVFRSAFEMGYLAGASHVLQAAMMKEDE